MCLIKYKSEGLINANFRINVSDWRRQDKRHVLEYEVLKYEVLEYEETVLQVIFSCWISGMFFLLNKRYV